MTQEEIKVRVEELEQEKLIVEYKTQCYKERLMRLIKNEREQE